MSKNNRGCTSLYNCLTFKSGVLPDSNNSKILIFSSWEMVPRMIGSLVSYEEERKTIARLINEKRQNGTGKQIKSPNYFASSRYPSPRLVAKNGSMAGLVYPSRVLSSLYDPIASYREGISDIEVIEHNVSSQIKKLIDDNIKSYEDSSLNEDSNWYHALPILLDGIEYAKQIDNPHVNKIVELIEQEDFMLGKMPSDLIEVLTNISIASPANCFMRIFRNPSIAMDLATEFLNYFNSPEATSIIELSIKKNEDEGTHWKNTLVYCKNGNIQSMLDEYIHLLSKGKGIHIEDSKALDKESFRIAQKVKTALKVPSASYKIESFDDFELKVNARKNAANKEEIEKTGSSLRSHFAAAFSKSDSIENEKMDRKDALRIAFNSPFWPFVLASTSIGQEGLDFHLYCRKIMHWNLPSNPIDLEQREGRINRYKCLAIRQNVAVLYGDAKIKEESKDIWNDLFEAAKEERKEKQSELIPFWCFGQNQQIKIERILAQYPMSLDEERYERLIKVLSLYRLTMGQARQEELLTHIFQKFESTEELKDLFIDLSPFSHQFKQNQKNEKDASIFEKIKGLFSF